MLSVHLAALGLLLFVAQIRYLMSPDRSVDLHLQISGLLLVWGATSIGLHYCSTNAQRERLAGTTLLCIDAVMVTVLFSLMSTPEVPPGPLLIGYPLIVVAGAMYFQVQRVVIVTVASILSYLALLVVEPSLGRPIHYHVCFLIMLISISACLVNLVRRVRTLKDYFDADR